MREIARDPSVFPGGWYNPPPVGVIALFGSERNLDRLLYSSARKKEQWPADDIFLNTQSGLCYLYASPVDRQTGIMGDFGMTVYFGQDPLIKRKLALCYRLDREIFDFVLEGKRFSDIAVFAKTRMDKYGLTNLIDSVTDESVHNIGHTIPFVYEELRDAELAVLSLGQSNWDCLKDMISKKRIFVNEKETFTVKPGCAFTIEPRPYSGDNPAVAVPLSFHTTVLYGLNGDKKLLTNFDEIFTLAGMDYII
jgi:hypothetical protein